MIKSLSIQILNFHFKSQWEYFVLANGSLLDSFEEKIGLTVFRSKSQTHTRNWTRKQEILSGFMHTIIIIQLLKF